MFCAVDIRNCLSLTLEPGLSICNFANAEVLNRLACTSRERLSSYRARFSDLAISIKDDEESDYALRSKAALDMAPFLISSQYLLHSVCGNWNNESPYAMSALRIHAIDIGAGQPGASRLDHYFEVLRDLSVADAGIDLLHTAEDARVSEGAFSFAANLVVLSHFPESLAGQILGANLYLRHCGILPPLELISGEKSSVRDFLDLGMNPSSGKVELRQYAEDAVLEYLEEFGEEEVGAVFDGYAWARHQTEALNENLLNILSRWLDPREAARHLISRRKPEACLYHERTKLNKMSMQALLAQDDALSFLEHLAASSFVRAGNPAQSPLLNGLISSRGKMFRIFSRDDITILHRWIAGLPYENAPLQPAAYLLWKDAGGFPKAANIDKAPPGDNSSIRARQAYSRLMHTEISLGDQVYARKYIKKWLLRASRGVEKGQCPLPREWTLGCLRDWLHSQHLDSNRSLDEPYEIPSREEVIADVLSLAPLTMIDGAWLAGFAHPSMGTSDSGYTLFETFFDELGNGIYEQNHPVIYRELLRVIYGELPATSDPSYANSYCFKDKDFELPVFWLSIGRYPQSYWPEILGLNLAMELSGVGGGYRRTHRALSAYGYPTVFVDLHNSIDNIATGHSAWAVASIDAYMSVLTKDDRAVYWERVCTGYVALNPPKEQSFIRKVRKTVSSML
ncbi:hypothetical protein GCM10008997_10910 [Halomonas salifodinae]